MSEKEVKVFDAFEFDDAIQPAFNQITKPERLRIDLSLPELKLSKIDRKTAREVKIIFIVPKLPRRVSVYLFINKKKKDMYFQIAPGLFNFTRANIKASDEVEIFYAVGQRRSNSLHINLKA